MEKKINIAELLKDCPKGMELYSTIYGTVYFEGVRDTGYATMIDVTTFCNTKESFYPDGKFNTYYSESEMTLFPSKDVRTWEGFHRPFMDGDVLVHTQNERFVMSIYKSNESEIIINTHAIFWDREEGLMVGMPICCYTDSTRFATEEEKRKLFQAIKANGYKWNQETKTLEKLVEPKFKVRDRIKFKYHERSPELIVKIEDNGYILSSGKTLMFQDEDAWELYTNKFDITTLKPFDKVLVRDTDKQEWNISFLGHCNGSKNYKYSCISGIVYAQCIPYNGNEHLLGTTNYCDDFYKTWE